MSGAMRRSDHRGGLPGWGRRTAVPAGRQGGNRRSRSARNRPPAGRCGRGPCRPRRRGRWVRDRTFRCPAGRRGSAGRTRQARAGSRRKPGSPTSARDGSAIPTGRPGRGHRRPGLVSEAGSALVVRVATRRTEPHGGTVAARRARRGNEPRGADARQCLRRSRPGGTLGRSSVRGATDPRPQPGVRGATRYIRTRPR